MSSLALHYDVSQISASRLYKVMDAKTKSEAIKLGLIDRLIDLFVRHGQKQKALGQLYDEVNKGVSQDQHFDPLYFHPKYRNNPTPPLHGFSFHQQVQKLWQLQEKIADSPHEFKVELERQGESRHGQDYALRIYHNGELINEAYVTHPYDASPDNLEYICYLKCVSFALACNLNQVYRQFAKAQAMGKKFDFTQKYYVQYFIEQFLMEQIETTMRLQDVTILLDDLQLDNGQFLSEVVSDVANHLSNSYSTDAKAYEEELAFKEKCTASATDDDIDNGYDADMEDNGPEYAEDTPSSPPRMSEFPLLSSLQSAE
ncbi:hypothetical protein [Parashewanella tropica]|uniref:hypothetical protein n=1 Tax=Parashewanella tropica TaxID=2547970 RepID=UPI00105A42A6|nr:hypothetical protein [Parashewanella tropica]